jgi:hypothetical protein
LISLYGPTLLEKRNFDKKKSIYDREKIKGLKKVIRYSKLKKKKKILYQISLCAPNLSIKHGQTPPLCMVIGFLLPHSFFLSVRARQKIEDGHD